MEYDKIYEVIRASGCSRVDDCSFWSKPVKTYIESNMPLRIILEHRHLNLQIWVVQEFGKFYITTAQLNLKYKLKEYYESFRYYSCKNPADMADKLSKLLRVETQGEA